MTVKATATAPAGTAPKPATTAVYTFINTTANGGLYVDLPFKRKYGLRKHITLKGAIATSNNRGAIDRADLRYQRDTSWTVSSINDVSVQTTVSGQSLFSLQVRHSANLPEEARKAHVREFLALLQANVVLLCDGVVPTDQVITVPQGTEEP